MRSGATRALVALVAVVACCSASCGQTRRASVAARVAVGRSLLQPPRGLFAAPPAPPPPAPVSEPAAAAPTAPRLKVAPPAPIPDGRIIIPKIGVDLATYEGVDPWTLSHGPGHWEQTAQPGQVGNTTFAGHRTTFTHPFEDIDQLAPGDQVTFVNASGVFTYQVTDAFVVGDDDSWIADPTDTPTFTLFACHPKGSERERYVVKGEIVTSAL